jgi:CRISPR-associated protein Csm3
MKLLTHKIIKGEIECITGLHIGGSAETIEIGGMDNPIIKHPISGFPYIPGSSIKGRMRSLLELKYGLFEQKGDVHKYCGRKDCLICRIFGTSADSSEIGLGRLIVRDAHLTETSIEELKKLKREKGLPYSEEKYENSINRINARANPRPIERVPAGIRFNFELVYRVFDMDDSGKTDIDLIKYVKEGLKLIENDALGGSGSRGSGKVKFNNTKMFDNSDPSKSEDFAI